MHIHPPIRNKRWLILGLLAVEIAVFAVGGFVGLRVVREQMASMIGEQVQADNARYAEGLAGVIESMGVGADTAHGSDGWRRMQRAVEQLEMPADGFACILDADNKILCHPELETRPGLLGQDLSSHVADVVTPGEVALATSVGQTYFVADGVHYIATRPIRGTGTRLLVHQPAQGLVSVSDAITTPLMATFILVGASVLLLTVCGSYLVTRRYEHVLEQANAGLEDTVRERTKKHTAARNALIFGLAKLADSRDSDTGEHIERMCAYSELIARQLQQHATHPEATDEWVRELRLAAALHDIGKVGVADSALQKPGKLNEQERKEIERHPQIAADTLLAIYQQMGDDALIAASVQVALYHHEKWDGSGYPFKLSGDGIPLSARIVAVADVYDALTSKRVYKSAMPHERAVGIINEDAGTHFDPAVVEAFNKVADQFPRIREQAGNAQAMPLSGIFGPVG